jgi:hypothetical protein
MMEEGPGRIGECFSEQYPPQLGIIWGTEADMCFDEGIGVL